MGGVGKLAAPDTGVFFSLRHLIETLTITRRGPYSTLLQTLGLRLETYSAKTGRPQSEKLD